MKLFSPKKSPTKRTRSLFATEEDDERVTPSSFEAPPSPLRDISNTTPPSSPMSKNTQNKGNNSPRAALAKLGRSFNKVRRPFSISVGAVGGATKTETQISQPVFDDEPADADVPSEKATPRAAESMPALEEESTWSYEPADYDELTKSARKQKQDATDENCTEPSATPRRLTNDIEYDMINVDLNDQQKVPEDFEPVKKVLLRKNQSDKDLVRYDDLETLSDSLKSAMFVDATFSDVVIRCGPKLATSYFAHRVILAHRSDYFKSILSNIDASKIERKDNLHFRFVIEKPQYTPEIFSLVLQYVYTGIIELECDNVLDVLDLADDLRLVCLKKLCTKYLIDNMDTENLCHIMQMSRRYHAPELTKACMMFIEKKENVVEVLRSFSLCELTVENLISLIKRDKLPLKCDEEIEVFEAVMRWHSHKTELENNGQKGEDYDLNEIMKYVRFPLMNVDQLSDIVEVSGAVSQPLLFEAYRHHIVPLNKLSENKKKMGIDEDQGLDMKDRELKKKRFSQRSGLFNQK